MEKVQFLNFQNCLRLDNGEIEIIVSTDFGPRILAYNFIGGQNILGIHADAQVNTELGEFKPYGGHRLWIAPENMPNSYTPDNSAIEYFYDEKENSIRLIQPIEPVTQTHKEIVVTLDENGSGISLEHKITNLGEEKIELAAWALTIMRGGGEVLIPNENFAPYSATTLLPVRNLAVWSYTDFSDSRWHFDRDFIRLKVDETKKTPQKIGILNKMGWVKYQFADLEFVKRFTFEESAVYPDMNSNTEIYTAGNFVEVETLSQLFQLEKGETAKHIELWELTQL